MPRVADKVRGVLSRKSAAGKFQHGRVAASTALRGIVQHFWSIRWDLRGKDPVEPATLPHPNVHLVFDAQGAKVSGVHTGRFTTKLEGQGWVFGVKFRPGAFRPFLTKSVATLQNRTIPLTQVFGAQATRLSRRVIRAQTDRARAKVIEDFLLARLPPLDPQIELLGRIADEIAENRAILQVEQCVDRWSVGKRALQLLFNEYVGVGPKWVISRYRLHEALERLHAPAGINFTDLALELGYFDQAHFIRDFRKLVGQSPAAYRRSHGSF
jgi:AraC-like DNA-binding protein